MAADPTERGRGRWRLLQSDRGQQSGALVRAADAFVARLGLSRRANWSDLQHAVEAIYGKPILLIASASSSMQAVTGLWIDAPDFGALVCRESDQLHYQAQNAFHELAHILFATAPVDWFTDELPSTPRGDQGGASWLCAYTDNDTLGRSRSEVAVEEVAFAMARAVQTLNRSNEETYFG